MPDHHHPESPVPERDRPTRKQLRYLRSLAMQCGQSFASPRTNTQASEEIRRLERAARSRRGAPRERAFNAHTGAGATSIRNDEITGYGATARWA